MSPLSNRIAIIVNYDLINGQCDLLNIKANVFTIADAL